LIKYGNILGFIDQNSDTVTPGAVILNDDFTIDTGRELTKWQLNADAYRVPLILGSYLLTCKDKSTSNPNYAIAKSILILINSSLKREEFFIKF
jgi:hypothetical protein